ncbi:MAG: DUF2399 domain-containing protein [Streptosporangiales bacterium]
MPQFLESIKKRHYSWASSSTASGRELADGPATAQWDDDLAAAMAAEGRAVEEEHVLDDLLIALQSSNCRIPTSR